MTNESTNLEKINTSKNEIGYNFKNYNKIVKYFNEIEAEWKGDVSLGPLETFWPQGGMSVNRIFREINKIFEKLVIMDKIHYFSKHPKKC